LERKYSFFISPVFRNFAIKDGEFFRYAQGNSSVSAKKETSFFVLLSTFRNFARILSFSLYKGNLGN